jgi:hypothetical protein
MTKTEYEWVRSAGIADQVLRKLTTKVEGMVSTTKADPPYGFIMKSGPTTYIAWIPNDTGNRMEFFDVETAKAWVFTQVRMSDTNALLTER